MSIRLMTFVWDHAPLKGSKLNVLLILADHANDEGRCWPSIKRIAHRARTSERQAQRVVQDLAAEGFVEIEERQGQTSVYTVILEGVTSTSGVTSGLDTPDIAVSPEPSLEPPTTEEPSFGGQENVRPTPSQLEREAIERIWVYWLEVSGKNQRLDDKRRRIIRNAIATVKAADRCDLTAAEAKVDQALLGLSLSPFHRGENDNRRPYMEIRYALKGRGDESDDERIEKACDWATVYAPGRQSTLDPDKAIRYLEEIREYVSRLSRDSKAITGRDRAIEALTKLRAGGYDVVRLERPPWARFK